MSLVTPAGTITFNSYNATAGYIRLSAVSGLDSPAIRATVDSKPQRDGALVGDAFFGARSVVLEGHIVPGSTGLSTRVVLADSLAVALASIMRDDGTLKWSPTGAAENRQMTVRLLDGFTVQSEDGILKKFQFALVSADHLTYGQTAFVSPFGTNGSGGQLSIFNSGNMATFPQINIYGPATGPVISNNTYSENLDFRANGGLVIAAGSRVFIDFALEAATVSIFDGSWLKMQYIDIAASTWWTLRPGNNVVRLTGTNVTTAGCGFDVSWRDAYA